MHEKENLLRIFEEAREAIKKEDAIKLKQLSNQTIHSASIMQDPDSIATAVIIYSLSKIIERERYQKYSGWSGFYKTVLFLINSSIKDIKMDDEKSFRKDLEAIRKAVNKLSGNLKKYIQDVFRKASINKASRIYEHGISMENTAKLLGITMFELANYAGQTGISETPLCRTCDVKDRIKLAMDMFK